MQHLCFFEHQICVISRPHVLLSRQHQPHQALPPIPLSKKTVYDTSTIKFPLVEYAALICWPFMPMCVRYGVVTYRNESVCTRRRRSVRPQPSHALRFCTSSAQHTHTKFMHSLPTDNITAAHAFGLPTPVILLSAYNTSAIEIKECSSRMVEPTSALCNAVKHRKDRRLTLLPALPLAHSSMPQVC